MPLCCYRKSSAAGESFLIPSAWLLFNRRRIWHNIGECLRGVFSKSFSQIGTFFCSPATLATLLAIALCGCATTKLPGVTEYNNVAGEAAKEVRRALDALDKIKATTPTPSKRVVSKFSDEVTRLQVQSVTIPRDTNHPGSRRRLLSRLVGEPRIEKDPAVRERAEHYRPELERTFADIKSASSRAGARLNLFSKPWFICGPSLRASRTNG